MSDPILTIKDVADYLKVNERTIYRLAASGELPGFKVGNSWRFKQSELEHYISSQHNRANVGESNKSKDNDKFEYEFDIKKMDNAIREIRWDPGENANVTINDVVVTVTCENDIEKKYSIEDVTTNGIDLGNHIVFVIPDPQVIISLGGKYHVSKVTIEGHGVRRISDLDNHKISRRSRTVFQKITRVCNKLKNKL